MDYRELEEQVTQLRDEDEKMKERSGGPANESGRDEEMSEQESAEAVETDILQLYEQVQKLSDERDQAKDQALRTMADFQNFRKRSQQEALNYRKLATENLVTSLLEVLDNFERTLQHLEAGAPIESVTDGIRAVERQLRTVLEGQGVSRIASVGQHFDPELHEALGLVDSPETEQNMVVQEVQPGYKLAEKVIRPARVKVAK